MASVQNKEKLLTDAAADDYDIDVYDERCLNKENVIFTS